MGKRIVQRGNTAFFTFTFYDEDGEVAIVSSAELQLTYPGARDYETETVALSSSGTDWVGEWDTTKCRPGFVDYHAHAYAAGGIDYAQDGRFRVTANRASLDHDALPTSSTPSSSAVGGGISTDYGL